MIFAAINPTLSEVTIKEVSSKPLKDETMPEPDQT
jgi:hypothetical protein